MTASKPSSSPSPSTGPATGKAARTRRNPAGSSAPVLHPRLLEWASELSFEPGTVLFRKGQAAESVFVLLSGEVSLKTTTRAGTVVTMGQYHGGQILAAASLSSGFHRMDGVCERSSRLQVLPMAKWRAEINGDPEVRWSWIASGQGASDSCVLKTHRLTLWRVEDRLRHLILSEGDEDQTLDWQGSQADLAKELGMTRFALCRVMGKLADEGRVDSSDGRIRWTGE